MTPTELYRRNTLIAIDVLVRGKDPQMVRRKYCIGRSSFRVVMLHMTHCTLGADYRHLDQVRELVSDRLADECLHLNRPKPACRIGASGTG